MTVSEFWAALKAAGYTQRQLIQAGGRRRVILQSRDKGEYPSITHPEDLRPDQRRAEVNRFLRIHG
jgi:hypothetical protein